MGVPPFLGGPAFCRWLIESVNFFARKRRLAEWPSLIAGSFACTRKSYRQEIAELKAQFTWSSGFYCQKADELNSANR
jgi:hypothetical protein